MACLVALMPQGKPVSRVTLELSDQARHNELMSNQCVRLAHELIVPNLLTPELKSNS